MKKKSIVKKSQNKVFLLIIAALAVLWLVALVSITDNSDAEEQDRLVKQAENYLADKIYIRAANSLKEALNYTTDKNRSIEDSLLSVYKEGGFASEYEELAKQRIGAGYATKEEYSDVINSTITQSAETALLFLKGAISAFPEVESFSELYDGLRFEIDRASLGISKYVYSEELNYILVNDGSKWGYINKSGRIVIPFKYDEAWPFYGKYAVVKNAGVYELIDSDQNRWSVDKNDLDGIIDTSADYIIGKKDGNCVIYSRTFRQVSDETYEDVITNPNGIICVKNGGKWALLDSKLQKITEYIFEDVVRNSKGSVFTDKFGVVADENGYYVVREDGSALFESRYKNARGFEGSLIAVQDGSGFWGFINGTGEALIPFQYMDAKSFSCDLAPVFYSGKWGYISRKGQLVINNVYDSAEPFNNGTAIVTDGLGECSLLTLKYYKYFK